MAQILKGKDVSDRMIREAKVAAMEVKSAGVKPRLVIIRMGTKKTEMAFESSIERMGEHAGVLMEPHNMPKETSTEDILERVESCNKDKMVHGIYVFHNPADPVSSCLIRNRIAPEKDVAGLSNSSLTALKLGDKKCFPPYQAQACLEILDYYGYPLRGKKAVIIMENLLIGDSVADLFRQKKATVDLCRLDNPQLSELCREADFLVTAIGKVKAITESYFNERQVVLDFSHNQNAAGMAYGDIDYQMASFMTMAVTPVPGGINAVMGAVLIKQTIKAAKVVQAAEIEMA